MTHFIVIGEVKKTNFMDPKAGKYVIKYFGDDVWMPGHPPKATAFDSKSKAKVFNDMKDAIDYIEAAKHAYADTKNFQVVEI